MGSVASANFREYIEMMGTQSYKPTFESKELKSEHFSKEASNREKLANSLRKSTLSDADSVKIKTDHEDNLIVKIVPETN